MRTRARPTPLRFLPPWPGGQRRPLPTNLLPPLLSAKSTASPTPSSVQARDLTAQGHTTGQASVKSRLPPVETQGFMALLVRDERGYRLQGMIRRRATTIRTRDKWLTRSPMLHSSLRHSCLLHASKRRQNSWSSSSFVNSAWRLRTIKSRDSFRLLTASRSFFSSSSILLICSSRRFWRTSKCS